MSFDIQCICLENLNDFEIYIVTKSVLFHQLKSR